MKKTQEKTFWAFLKKISFTMNKLENLFLSIFFLSPAIPSLFIVYSIRFDQVLIYVLFLSTVIIFRKNIDLKLYKILFPYISFLIIIILGFNLYEYNIVLKHDYKINYAIANIEDKNKKSLDKIQLKIFYLLTLCMLLNSIVAIISYTSPTFYEIIHGLYIDSSNVESQKTVASRAYINGRSIGFFDKNGKLIAVKNINTACKTDDIITLLFKSLPFLIRF